MGQGSSEWMKVGPPMVSALRTAFIASTGYDMQTVLTNRQVGWPAASMAAKFFFQRWCMIRFLLPGGLNVVCAP